jgi:hypothetical protein
MDERTHPEQKPAPFHERIGALLRRERRTFVWSVVAGVLLGATVVILLRRYLLALLIALLAGLGHGCREMLDNLRELH